MRALAVIFLCATAWAAPSAKHQHLHHPVRRDVVTKFEIDWVTTWVFPSHHDVASSTAATSTAVSSISSHEMSTVLFGTASSAAASSVAAQAVMSSAQLNLASSVTTPSATSSAETSSIKGNITSSLTTSSATASTQAPIAQLIASSVASPSASPSAQSGSRSYKQMVVFGDNLSDNGNGSCAHGVAGNPETIYGYGTWTDGPIAASYLSTLLGVPLTKDYAFGHAAGGSKFGATIQNNFTQSDANAPDAPAQIQNYTSSADYKDNVADTLHFFWFGNNDVLPFLLKPVPHIFFGAGADQGNAKFATDLAAAISNNVQTLIDAGAQKIIVPNIYPRHLAPVVAAYFNLLPDGVAQYGSVIESTNSQLKANLEPMGDKVIYYDVYSFMMNVYNQSVNGGYDGIVNMTPGADICDGATTVCAAAAAFHNGTTNWDYCQELGYGRTFYWMQFIDPTSHVHQLVAQDMARVIKDAL